MFNAFPMGYVYFVRSGKFIKCRCQLSAEIYGAAEGNINIGSLLFKPQGP